MAGWCVLSPCSGLGPPLHVVPASLLFVWCRVCCGWGSAVVGWWNCVTFCSALPHSFRRVCCHSIVGLGCVNVTGLCHCGIAVWVCVGVERRGAFHSRCGVWNGGVCGCVVLSFVLFCLVCLSFSLFVVGVRGSARAALRARTLSPNTIVCLSSVLFTVRFLYCPPFVCWNGGGGLPCVAVLCWHDGDG